MRLRGLSDGHVTERDRVIRRLARYLDKDPLTATAQELQRWAVDFVPRTRQTPRGRHNVLSHVHCFYSWAVEHELMDVDPSARIPRPKLSRMLPRPISEDDLRLAVSNADRRLGLWLTLAAYAGLRACEIARLERNDILDKAVPPVLIAHGKGSKDRVVPLNQTVMAALERYGLDRNEYGLRRRGPMFPRLDGQPRCHQRLTREHGCEPLPARLGHRGHLAFAPSLLRYRELQACAGPPGGAGTDGPREPADDRRLRGLLPPGRRRHGTDARPGGVVIFPDSPAAGCAHAARRTLPLGSAPRVARAQPRSTLMRLDRVAVCSLLDEDGVVRPARVLAERDGRVLVMVTRDVGMTHVLWLSADRLR